MEHSARIRQSHHATAAAAVVLGIGIGLSGCGGKSDEQYGEQEAQRRFVAALRGARVVGHKPQSEMKLGKREGKTTKMRKKAALTASATFSIA